MINNPVVMRSKERKTFAAVCPFDPKRMGLIVVVTEAFSVIDLY